MQQSALVLTREQPGLAALHLLLGQHQPLPVVSVVARPAHVAVGVVSGEHSAHDRQSLRQTARVTRVGLTITSALLPAAA